MGKGKTESGERNCGSDEEEKLQKEAEGKHQRIAIETSGKTVDGEGEGGGGNGKRSKS